MIERHLFRGLLLLMAGIGLILALSDKQTAAVLAAAGTALCWLIKHEEESN